ncbi:MAG: hypothetical protein AAB621_00230 [Patescibacteria group bacterium]
MWVNLAEEIVEKALMLMKKGGKLSGFQHSKKNDKMDAAGIDFLVFSNNGSRMDMQVKTYSNESHNKQKLKEHFRKHPDVKFVIFVKVDLYRHQPEKVLKYIQREVESFLKTVQSRQ